MDSTAIRKKNRRSRAVRAAAWKGAAEALERRVLLSGSVGKSVEAFILNQGQWADPGIRYAIPNPNGNIFITDNGPIFQLFHTDDDGTKYSESFFVTFDGANTVRPTGLVKSDGAHNFYVGDESTWRENVPGYDKIVYKELYEGVNLYAWGKKRSLKYEFHVAPGADWEQVQISYEGITGLSIDAQGRLHIKSQLGEFIDDAPLVYQVINGKRVVIQSSFRLVDGDTYTFQLHGDYDPRHELILDPVIDWSTYLGSVNEDHINAVATDSNGLQKYAYVTGYSENGVAFPLTDTIRLPNHAPIVGWKGAFDVFVSKFDSNGTLVWNTFLGGVADNDIGNDLVVDGLGRVVVVGETESSDFATSVGAEDRIFGTNRTNGDVDAFVARFAANGTLQYSTFLGIIPGQALVEETQGNEERATGVDVDQNNVIYVVGSTEADGYSTLMPDLLTTTVLVGQSDGFVAKMNLDAFPQTVWRRYLGGSAAEALNDIDVTPGGNIFVVGNSNSPTNGTPNANLPIAPGFASSGHLTIGAFQVLFGGGANDAYAARLTNNGALQWGTYIGGTGADVGNGIAVNENINQIAVVGQAGSSDFDIVPLVLPPTVPVSPITLQGSPIGSNIRQGTNDAFITKLTLGGLPTLSAYLGGSSNNDTAVAVAYSGTNVLIAGNTDSPNFPFFDFRGTQGFIVGGVDAFVLSLSFQNAINYAFPFGGAEADTATDIAVDSSGAFWLAGFTASLEGDEFTGFNLFGKYRNDPIPPGSTFPPLFAFFGGEDDGFLAHFSESPASAPIFPPTNATAVALSTGSVRVTWVDNSFNELGFLVRRKLGNTGQYQDVATVGFNVRVYTDSNLLPDTTYYYVVYAFNLTGYSFASNPAKVITRSASVGAPTNLQVTPISSNRIDLSWTDNADNETDFEIHRAVTGTGDFTVIDTVGANATTFQDTGLTAGTQYTYRVRAINDFRASNFSNDATTTTLGGTFIVAPSDLVATTLSSTSIRLDWVDESDNETGFSVERSVFGSGVFNEIGATGAGETSFTDSLVLPGVIYIYRVRAFNGLSFSSYSNTSNPDPALALGTPTLVEALPTSSSSILLTWFDKAVVETGYVIERAIGQPSDFTQLVTTGPNVTSFTDTGLQPRTRYFYRMRATDGTLFSPYSIVTSATTLAPGFFPPPSPTVIRGRALSFSSIQVTWQDNSSTESAFSIERATLLDGPYATVGTVVSNTTLFVDTGLQDGTVYYYRVIARQGTTESLPSAIIKVRTIVKARVVINATDAIGSEPDDDLVFNVRRKDTFSGDLIVFYTVSGTATNGQDYNNLRGSVTIPNGQPTADIVVAIKDDSLFEGNETVTITLANNANYKVSPSLRTANGVIEGDIGVGSLPAGSRTSVTTSSPFSKKSLGAIKLLDDLL